MQSLRGQKAKENFIKEYSNIRVLAFVVLLNGDTRKNQCGGELTDKYYHFSAVCNKTAKEEIFFLGYDCGKQLLNLLNISADSIKLFNPLTQTNSKITSKINTNGSVSDKIKFTPLGNELFNLANLICIGLRFKKTKIIDDINSQLYKNKDKDPPAYLFKSINTILQQYQTTMQEITDKLKRNNPNLKDFNFAKSREYLKNYFAAKGIIDEIICI